MSLGEARVRTKFNPSADSTVDQIKQKTAELIDLCHREQQNPRANSSEVTRLWGLAMAEYENAAMWAVKAATTDK